jgi:membrane protein implicated in regulation of membrane protease activity
MDEPLWSAALAMHGLGWWVLLLILLLLVFASLPVLFVYLLARAVRRGTRPQETLTTLSLRPEADRPNDRQ